MGVRERQGSGHVVGKGDWMAIVVSKCRPSGLSTTDILRQKRENAARAAVFCFPESRPEIDHREELVEVFVPKIHRPAAKYRCIQVSHISELFSGAAANTLTWWSRW